MGDRIVFEPLFSDVIPPQRATAGSAGLDLEAYLHQREVLLYNPDNCPIARNPVESLTIPGGHRALIPLGFKAKLPSGWEGQLRPRSGLSLKEGLTVVNSPGTVDEDFAEEWGVLLHNTSTADVVIRHKQRIAQLVLQRVEDLPFDFGTVGRTTAREGGLGSTGA